MTVIMIAGCNNHSADKYLKQAKAAVDQKKYTEAVKLYETLVSEFPKDTLAPTALYQLGALYQNKLVPGTEGPASTEKAVSVFKSVFDKYPDSKEAPSCLFMCGFLQSNELNRYSDATVSYNMFLQKYPKNDMASAAKYELDNMGLTPGQVLEQKISTSK
jgi:TolA-binding protein